MQQDVVFNLLTERVSNIVSQFGIDTPEIKKSTYFAELGASSCDRAVIAAEMLELLDLNIAIEEILVADTIGEMVRLIDRNCSSARASHYAISLS